MKKMICVFGVYVFLATSVAALPTMAQATTFVCHAEGWRNVAPPMAPISRRYVGRGQKQPDAQMQAIRRCQNDFNDHCILQSCFKEKRAQ